MGSELQLTKSMGRWLGLLITDGTISKYKRYLKFTNKEKTLLDEFALLTQNNFNLIGKRINGTNRTPDIQVNSVHLVKQINIEFVIPLGDKSNIITVPTKILNCKNNEVLSSFLSGVFDGDGSAVFNKKHNIRRVDLTSGSSRFLEQVQELLLNFGIESRLAKKETRLLITKKNDIKRFHKFIGFKHPIRQKRLLEMLN